jgi:hypothetical protein
MNSLCKHHIARFHQQYINRTFDQDDVTLFLVLVRDFHDKNSVFKELGDFLAHPECKSQGLTLKNFSRYTHSFETNIKEIFIERNYQGTSYKGIGTFDDIFRGLKQTFKLVGLKLGSSSKGDLAFRDFVFCLIFMLNNFKLQVDDRLFQLKVIYGHSLELNNYFIFKCL